MQEILTPVEIQRPALVDIRDARLRRLYEYWLEKRGDRRFPSRRDIDPIDFSYVLGHVILVDVLRDPLRFRVRVHGTEMVAKAGYDLTGKFLDDHPISEYRHYVMERCEGLVRDGEPLLVRHDRTLDGKPRRYEALWLPLSDDGRHVTKLLATQIYDWQIEQVAFPRSVVAKGLEQSGSSAVSSSSGVAVSAPASTPSTSMVKLTTAPIIEPGTVVKVRGTRALVLKVDKDGIRLLADAGILSVSRREVSIPKVPLEPFAPMRLWLAYGIWIEQDGSKVLFSCDYYPLWRIAPDGTVTADEPWRFVDYAGRADYLFDDETAPWWNAPKAQEIEHLMKQMGVSGAPKLLDVIGILLRGEAENIRQAVRQMVPPGIQPHPLL
ncbi:MAG TPA: PAS domain-containing protein [Stellaceae bacterium]|nr:PAS domain-containing protein [Stellaceae bacterium]